MKLKRQFINLINAYTETFTATFEQPNYTDFFGDKERDILTFQPLSGCIYRADVLSKHSPQSFNVGRVTNTSVHLYSYVAGCRVSVIIPFTHLVNIDITTA